MAFKTQPCETVPAAIARRLLLSGTGLLDDPSRAAGQDSLFQCIESMGYVQVDTISIFARAHHHILRTRFERYRRRSLKKLLEEERRLFEHFTHDASVIPVGWLRPWMTRFERHRRLLGNHRWFKARLGEDADRIVSWVRGRVRAEGPLMSRDLQTPQVKTTEWWGWTPQKTALEYLWHCGELAVVARSGFQKVYDLMERVFPHVGSLQAMDSEEHLAWACTQALDRLGMATAGEIAGFFDAVSAVQVKRWCDSRVKEGTLDLVEVQSADAKTLRRTYAVADWRERAEKLANAPSRMRLLSPFDPAVRDRTRTQHLFGFDYRFEAFVPRAKRRYGYFVLPLLVGDRLAGRLDAACDRRKDTLKILGLWWEKGQGSPAQRRKLEGALTKLLPFLKVTKYETK